MVYSIRQAAAAAAAIWGLAPFQAAAQTSTSCDPLDGTCSADTALGQSISVDFTQGEVESFTSSGGTPTYGSDGVTFTITESGDAPQLNSIFYIMFGRIEFQLKAATGAGIVSSVVMISDDLDEIDLEWLGADNYQVATNYFGKGITTDYNRGEWDAAAGCQEYFNTYTVDWTSERIVWAVNDTVIRTLTAANAETNQYPQTPMQIRFGIWSGGDSSNSEGTIEWARGPTNYSDGPFSMTVKNMKVTDYSTGTKYTYGDTSGNWTSIESTGGEINGNLNGAGSLTVTATATGAASTATVLSGGLTDSSGETLPSGWYITSTGKIRPISSATIATPNIFFVAASTIIFSVFAALAGSWRWS
ncbi:concanavalin A-like lectin/glucanase domain-containing protein [Xylariales sp. PMI_506]|nr:concanavalin A-like lectin/glucanase domain-containing protein [Xylariales sp. PMI_506]